MAFDLGIDLDLDDAVSIRRTKQCAMCPLERHKRHKDIDTENKVDILIIHSSP